MEQQYQKRLEVINDKMAQFSEGLTALAWMMEVCDEKNAPQPYQLSCLVNVMSEYACQTANNLYRLREELGQI